jgi:putative ABC transport system permease protein
MHELRYAVRQLWRAPGFTAVAVLTLALGTGANTAFFSVLHGVVLRQVPYDDPTALVRLFNATSEGPADGGTLSRAELRDYAGRQRAFESVGASNWGRATLTSNDGAERLKVADVTPNLFSILRVRPARGRDLTDADAKAGAKVAVVGHDFWRAHLGGAADVLGREVRLNGVSYTVVGVMPPGFSYPEQELAVWRPLDLSPRGVADRTDHYLTAIARRRPGVTASAAEQDLQRVARDLQRDDRANYPSDRGRTLASEPLRRAQFGHMLAPLGVLAAAAAVVLLIACVNVASMSLLRALARRREMAIRLALGASRWQIARQLLAEAAVLCTLGTAVGVLVTGPALALLKAFAPAGVPRLDEVAIDPTVAVVTGAILIATTLLVGLAPAAIVSHLRRYEGSSPTTRITDGRGATRLRESFTVVQIALATALLVGAGLTVRSLTALLRVDVGFATDRIYSFKTNLTEDAYPDAERAGRFYRQLEARVQELPGTRRSGTISFLPLSGEGRVVEVGRDAGDASPRIPVGWGIIGGRYFETMGVPLITGRLFTSADTAASEATAVVDEALARRFWTDPAHALGQTLYLRIGSSPQTRTVVGVVGNVSHLGPGKDRLPMVYAPHAQVYQRGMYTVVNTDAPAGDVAAGVRAALAAIDPSIPMYFAETVTDRYDETVALPRFVAGLVSAFSSLALVLAGVGIFGVTGFAVGQRLREFGIRLALGAGRSHVSRLVLGRVLRLTALGVPLGLFLALASGRLVAGLLYGVTPTDTPTLVVAALALPAVAFVAALMPLRQALSVNPAETLRAE